MAATSANPVVLNAVQILRADYVVSADVEGGEVKAILKQWRGERLNAAITLLERNALPDGSYILPLTRSGDGFVVTPITASGKSPTVYPDTDETRTQLVALLEQRQLKN
ncbi:hypothetical protein GC176_28190 [bacterium]|nr:hypothetical protein [bacterium]